MANWKHTIELEPLFSQWHSDALTPKQMGLALNRILQQFIENNPDAEDYLYFSSFSEAVDSIRYVEDADEIDELLNDIYDFADANSIWINTF